MLAPQGLPLSSPPYLLLSFSPLPSTLSPLFHPLTFFPNLSSSTHPSSSPLHPLSSSHLLSTHSPLLHPLTFSPNLSSSTHPSSSLLLSSPNSLILSSVSDFSCLLTNQGGRVGGGRRGGEKRRRMPVMMRCFLALGNWEHCSHYLLRHRGILRGKLWPSLPSSRLILSCPPLPSLPLPLSTV